MAITLKAFFHFFFQNFVALKWQKIPNIGRIHVKIALDFIFLTKKQQQPTLPKPMGSKAKSASPLGFGSTCS